MTTIESDPEWYETIKNWDELKNSGQIFLKTTLSSDYKDIFNLLDESKFDVLDTAKLQNLPKQTLQTMSECYALFALTLGRKFDVVIIDGGDIDGRNTRFACAETALRILDFDAKEGAMIILDNSDWHASIAKKFRDDGRFIEVDFHGFGHINAYTWTTSIFFTRNFNFKPLNGVQPHYSKDALEYDLD